MRNTIILLLIVFVAGACGGWILNNKLHPPSPPIEIVKNVDKPVYKTVYVPQGQAEWDAWAKTPIIIDRELDDKNYYHIYAHDGYKEARVTDKITVGSTGNWKLNVGIGVLAFAAGAGGLFLITQPR